MTLQPRTIRLIFSRDVLLLLPIAERQVLQFLIGFCCRVARPSSSKSRYAALRDTAQIFGPCLASGLKPADWMSCLFELLMYANGISQTDIDMDESAGLVWKVNHGFATEIKDRLSVTRTPSKKLIGLTPRRMRVGKRVPLTGCSGGSRRLFQGCVLCLPECIATMAGLLFHV